ncbi:hypothetical protein [Carboxylicivirga linearis]|uniref:Uncharacterized protein n=1 Tax=Carboxylicivirga linearis TaxID=1628157 RepID=A0ABS5K151_9BACT|nr:hypothetical protein [Carboxylicivirga linearis]MBS2100840.1 hypothetical protein [Carboxylicivirga linearis]
MLELLKKLQANSNLITNTVAEISNQLQFGEAKVIEINESTIRNIETLKNTDIYMLLKTIKSMSVNFDNQIIIELESTYDYVLLKWSHALLTESAENVIDIYEYNVIADLTEIIEKQINDINKFCELFLKKEPNEQLSGFELLTLYKGSVRYEQAINHIQELKLHGFNSLNEKETLEQILLEVHPVTFVKGIIEIGAKLDEDDFDEDEWEVMQLNFHLIEKNEYNIKFLENYKEPNALKDATIDKIFDFLVKERVLVGVDRNIIVNIIKNKKLPVAETERVLWDASHQKARIFKDLLKWSNAYFNKCFMIYNDKGELEPLKAKHKVRTNSYPKFQDGMQKVLDSENTTT